MGSLNNYKPSVSAFILSKNGKVLLTHNKNHGPKFWKLPQGGVEAGESLKEAVMREMKEELNLSSLSILKQSRVEYKYDWPKEVQEKKGFVGPSLTFFILRCKNRSTLKPNEEELDGLKWVNLDNLHLHFSTLPDFAKIIKRLISEARLTISS